MKTAWVDLETTGLSELNNQIIELAILYEDGNDRNKAIFHKYCLPDEKPVDWEKPLNGINKTITQLTGITWDKLLKEGVSEHQLFHETLDFLNERISSRDRLDKAIFAAYNAKFDAKFLRSLFTKHHNKFFNAYFDSATLDIMSTVGMAKRIGVLPVLANNKNVTVAKHFGIKFKAHSAIEDIKASRQIQLNLEKLFTQT